MSSYIEELPEELILKILSYTGLKCRSLLNFGETCKTFNNLVHDQILWKNRLHDRYPNIYHVILLYGTDDYFDQYKYVRKLETIILKELNDMSPKLFWRSKDLTFDDAAPYFSLCRERNISLYCVYSILLDTHFQSGAVIASDYPSTSQYSLTVQYYATHMIRLIIHTFLIINWRGMKLSLYQISPERALNFYTNWIDTFNYKEYEVTRTLLDNLAEDVWKELPVNHPVHAVSYEIREEWIGGLLKKNAWKLEDSYLVHAAIRNLLYNKLGIKIDDNLSPVSICLVNLLKKKKGHYYAVAVLYEALARRSGLKCEIIAFPEHFFLEWRENEEDKSPKLRVNLSTGELQRLGTCPFATGIPNYQTEEFILLLNNDFRKMLEHERNASLIIKVDSLDEMLLGQRGNHVDRYHNKYQALISCNKFSEWLVGNPAPNIAGLEDNFRRLLVEFIVPAPGNDPRQEISKPTIYRNRKSSQVHFAVGMVCGHRMYNYTCVVTGWDVKCTAPPEWQGQMGVSQLEYKDRQPFYYVYATDGTKRYVAQENLTLIVGQRPKMIEDVIGREFSHYNGAYYIPNAEKQKEYPDEPQIIAAYRRAPTLLMSTCKLTKPVPGHLQVFNWR